MQKAPYTAMTDDVWVDLLIRHAKGEDVPNIALPGFPPDSVQTSTVGSARQSAIYEAGRFYIFLKNAMANAGIALSQDTALLDFGCGWGRMMRFFQKDLNENNIHGADINKYLLDEAHRSGVRGHFAHIDARGLLPYANRQFDLIYAYSVFTHLPEPIQDHWLRELSRTIKPGGVFIATVEPPRFLDFFLNRDPNDTKQHPWHLQMTRDIHAKPELKKLLADRGFAFISGSDLYGDCVISKEYVFKNWSKYFDVVDYLDDKDRFWQAIVTCRGKQ